ncbi:jg7568 [Pararge aegeria aegeria]|uniref:Jg7568 protein n=1 Tax=Pararge aegeria aegeria TaxID=348720 RepID=A0A8S4QFS4_9NEOP|nr:jg7568 [Pararge aegeria aegeria]
MYSFTLSIGTQNDEKPTVYLEKIVDPNEEPWSWVEEELSNQAVEAALAEEEEVSVIEKTLLLNLLMYFPIFPAPVQGVRELGKWEDLPPSWYCDRDLMWSSSVKTSIARCRILRHHLARLQ